MLLELKEEGAEVKESGLLLELNVEGAVCMEGGGGDSRS